MFRTGQASVINRIFEMCADGTSLSQMAKKLNGEGVLSPQPPRGRSQRSWAPSAIREILFNDRYRGVLVWNRTKKERTPETGKKISRPRPASEWQRVEVPELRIVSDDLWNRAHASLDERKRRFGALTLASGVTRASTSKYLFSGLLVCGECGSRLVIVSGDGKRAYKKYGCPNHRYRGTCSNCVYIRQDRLEEQLLFYIESEILANEMAAYTVGLFEQELNKRLEEMAANSEIYASEVQKLRADRHDVRTRAVAQKAKVKLAQHIKELVLTPRQRDGEWVDEVTGE